jgi:hypothetical protein
MIHYCLPINIVMLVIIDKFNPNSILVNTNKLKPYKSIKDQTLEPILVKLDDFLLEELVQVKYFDNMSNQQ